MKNNIKHGVNIFLTTKNVYGVKRFYPDCVISEAICNIKNTPTILPRDIAILRHVGFIFTISSENEEK